MAPFYRLAVGALFIGLSIPPVTVWAVPAEAAAAERSERLNAYRDRLFDRLKNAVTEAEGRAIENAIWEMWMADAPTAAIGRDVKNAMDARESYDFDRALSLLDGVVATAPDYAEGWNQRAFIRFLKEDLDGALEDLDRTLELEPRHFGALSGKAIVLMQQGRVELGHEALREAVEIHPWLKERSMLPPDPAPEPQGRDI